MGYAIEKAVERVIATMKDNLGEHLTMDDMARAAMFSKFHLSRMFHQVTGVSPGRFLSALRIQRAQQLLLATSLNVTDICMQVGYNSVGTFSSRFTRSVGLSPTMYRQLGGFAPHVATSDHGADSIASGVVQGHVGPRLTSEPGLIFVGLFPHRVPEGRPVKCTILNGPGPFLLDKVPDGVWYLLTQSVSLDVVDACGPAGEGWALSVGVHGPITVGSETIVRGVDLRLRPTQTFDPPILVALLDVRRVGPRMVGRDPLGLSRHEVAVQRLRRTPGSGGSVAWERVDLPATHSSESAA